MSSPKPPITPAFDEGKVESLIVEKLNKLFPNPQHPYFILHKNAGGKKTIHIQTSLLLSVADSKEAEDQIIKKLNEWGIETTNEMLGVANNYKLISNSSKILEIVDSKIKEQQEISNKIIEKLKILFPNTNFMLKESSDPNCITILIITHEKPPPGKKGIPASDKQIKEVSDKFKDLDIPNVTADKSISYAKRIKIKDLEDILKKLNKHMQTITLGTSS